MTIDLTNIGGNTPRPNNPQPQPRFTKSQVAPENLKVPQSSEAKRFRKNHWTPDKFVQDGQIKAGEVDEAHKEFLKNTEWVD